MFEENLHRDLRYICMKNVSCLFVSSPRDPILSQSELASLIKLIVSIFPLRCRDSIWLSLQFYKSPYDVDGPPGVSNSRQRNEKIIEMKMHPRTVHTALFTELGDIAWIFNFASNERFRRATYLNKSTWRHGTLFLSHTITLEIHWIFL